ncbi:acetate/propionate family kinase [Pikeienuella sp. HZG-20]|uniref:acetate/propionate family kinase n=1 Tax=Paludibacillus litoralis TaxID=3133267 RepID=UPI0030EBE970
MSDLVLTLNAGSSSLKFGLFPRRPGATALIRGKIAGIGRAPVFTAQGPDGDALEKAGLAEIAGDASHEALVALLLDWLEAHQGGGALVAVGHRVVHGGREFHEPARVDEEVLAALDKLTPLAPLHQPQNLAAVRAVAARRPDLPQIVCFDTSFHRTQGRLARTFALPRALTDQGIIRYGFHGLSYEYIAGTLPDHLGARADGRVVVAHLGNGASMCALKERKSVATSMGFAALDGLMMGRRCGSLDPAVVLHLIENDGMSAAEVGDLLYNQSGLLGVSGISNNMRVLEESDDPHAREAIELFCYRAASVLGALSAENGGLDALVFTAGIGENSAEVRRLICERMGWLGVELDAAANAAGARRISSARSAVDVLVLPTDEEAVIARATIDMAASI